MSWWRREEAGEIEVRKIPHPLPTSLHKGVLLVGTAQLGERRQQALHARAVDLHKLAGHQRCWSGASDSTVTSGQKELKFLGVEQQGCPVSAGAVGRVTAIQNRT